jgi:hypothetical protein
MSRLLSAILAAALITATTACATPPVAPTAEPPPGNATTGPPSGTVNHRAHVTGSDRAAGKRSPACGDTVVADESDNGGTVCVAAGSHLTILLAAGTGVRWSDPEVAGNALGPGRGMPTPSGAVGWSFEAVAAGTARVTVTRTDCCRSSAGYRVDVLVR